MTPRESNIGRPALERAIRTALLIRNVRREIQTPWWAGFVTEDWPRGEIVVAPMPLNVLLRAAWLLLQCVRYPFAQSCIHRRAKALRDHAAILEEHEQWIRKAHNHIVHLDASLSLSNAKAAARHILGREQHDDSPF